ncbi:hypothetical protein lerEdw1_007049 [Lerista edwardsae]|nr:hypothetical protein lerEdw1_007049 [Lerista edwardsae]
MKGSRIELGDVTPHNIKQLKRLNQVIFPVSYNDKFYKDVLEVGELAKLAYFNDIAVGAKFVQLITGKVNGAVMEQMSAECLKGIKKRLIPWPGN